MNKNKRYPALFMAPGVLIYGVFFILPVLIGVWYSKGPLETYISEVLVGTKTPADVAAALDADFAKAAIDAGDPNWN